MFVVIRLYNTIDSVQFEVPRTSFETALLETSFDAKFLNFREFQMDARNNFQRTGRGINSQHVNSSATVNPEDLYKAELSNIYWLLFFLSDGTISKCKATHSGILLELHRRLSVKVIGVVFVGYLLIALFNSIFVFSLSRRIAKSKLGWPQRTLKTVATSSRPL